MTIFYPNAVSAALAPSELAKSIEVESSKGILLLTDLPKAPFAEIQAALSGLSSRPDISARLNKAYTKNLVYKDSFAKGKGGAMVDMKRVLDLSPERIDAIRKNDPNLVVLEEGALANSLKFYEELKSVSTKIVRAVADVIGSEDVVADAAFNYRMLDYYEREKYEDNIESAVAPRCGEHRDFGSFTLIFPSHAGFQVNMNGEWMDLESVEEGTAILLFGWCSQIRSNNRIPALLHRVTDAEGVTRRASAVLFCAPKLDETPLEPVLRSGEERVYMSGVKAGQLRGSMRRKWQKREGTLSREGMILEEQEILVTNMMTQDDVVQQNVVSLVAASAK